ncbi:PEP-CTERM sorting domain-containing protein [Phycisphaeraceae bacterium AH-315-B13]|nr:PEP-CTERM sorting domain-containing protein [Phycisphaeraceae bacterium AH-315-B13]PHQ79484.1 MAG: hypothetical protein COB69_07900 [Phycisphaera sp.]
MTKTIIFVAGLAVASSASADLTNAPISNLLDPSMYSINAQEIGSPDLGGIAAVHYSNMGGAFATFGPQAGFSGFDDYQSTAGADMTLTEMRFVGGVDTTGGVAFFQFFDAASSFVSSFGIAFPQAGNFIWTITIGSAPTVAENGLIQMIGDDLGAFGPATLSEFFLIDSAPTVGGSDINVGGNPGTHNQAFELTGDPIPAPASVALLGLGGLAAVRRRR